MIVVFCELGGERLLGKSREIADSLGVRVLAFCPLDNHETDFSQKLISLGADEVITCRGTSSVGEWAYVLSTFISQHPETRFLLGASGFFSDAIFGKTYALLKERAGAFASGVDSLTETEAIRNLHTSNSKLVFKNASEGKVNIFSLRPSAFPEPFEDTSRYGKESEMEVKSQGLGKSPNVSGLGKSEYLDSSSVLTVLVGKSFRDMESSEIQNLASKYRARIIKQSSEISDVYGPCLMVDVKARHEADLPRFHREVIALVSTEKDAAISVADSSYLTEEIRQVLGAL